MEFSPRRRQSCLMLFVIVSSTLLCRRCEGTVLLVFLTPLLFCMPSKCAVVNNKLNVSVHSHVRGLLSRNERILPSNILRFSSLPNSAQLPSPLSSSRRKLLGSVVSVPLMVSTIFLLQQVLLPASSTAAAIGSEKSTLEAKTTDRIFIEVNGLPPSITSGGEPVTSDNNNRIVIGLFGEDAAGPVDVIKQLVSKEGYLAKCRPREDRMLQKEQLEANKVFNSCIENEGKGVEYDSTQVWRVSKNKRIDLGAVSGKYIAREYPNFSDDSSPNGLRHDVPGVVSVRRGNDGGFGFTIYPGSGGDGGGDDIISTSVKNDVKDLDRDNIVIGRVLEGMDVVMRMNEIPVIQSAKLSFGNQERAGPSRACRYGSANVYCNELKPLRKLTISRTGIIVP